MDLNHTKKNCIIAYLNQCRKQHDVFLLLWLKIIENTWNHQGTRTFFFFHPCRLPNKVKVKCVQLIFMVTLNPQRTHTEINILNSSVTRWLLFSNYLEKKKKHFFFRVCVTPTGCNCWLTCVLRKWGRYFLRRADSALLTDLVSRKWTACTFSGLSLQVQTQQWVWRKALKDTEGEKQAASVVVLTGKYVSLINEVFLWGFPVHSCPDFHSDLGGEVWSA